MNILTSFAITTITSALLGAPASGMAASDEMALKNVMTQVVRFDDLDLADQNDAQELLQRLQIAARNSCKRTTWSWDRDRFHVDLDHCKDTAYKGAVAQLDSHFNIDLEEIAGVSPRGNALAATK